MKEHRNAGNMDPEALTNRKSKQQNDACPSLPGITLNVNGLNSPIKRQRLAVRIRMIDPTMCPLQESLWIQRHT